MSASPNLTSGLRGRVDTLAHSERFFGRLCQFAQADLIIIILPLQIIGEKKAKLGKASGRERRFSCELV